MASSDTFSRRLRSLLLALIAAGLIPACGDDGGTTYIPVAPTVSITTLSATPMAVLPGGNVALSALAADSSGGALTYQWTAASGSLSAPSGATVNWTAPGSLGSYGINLSVTSTSGASAAAVVGVVVSGNPGGSIITITSISATPSSVLAGAPVSLSASAAYSGAGTLTYSWAVSSGSLGAPTGSPAGWTAPSTIGSHLATLTVTDGLGEIASGAVGILVTPNPSGAVVTSVQPVEVRAGDTFVVRGTSFGSAQGSSLLTLSGVPTRILSWSDTEIRAVLPIGAPTGPVRVESSAGPSSPGFVTVLWPWFNPSNVPVVRSRIPAYSPKCAPDGSGGMFAVWMEDAHLFLQRMGASGTPVWKGYGRALCRASGSRNEYRIIPDGVGGAIVAWQDERLAHVDIYAQRVDADGVPQWTIDGVRVCGAPGGQILPDLCSDGAGGAIVVWQDFRGNSKDVYAQRVNGAGELQWAAEGVAICAAADHQTLPRLVSDGSGGAILVWKDERGPGEDIYAQRIDGLGASQWTLDGVALCTNPGSQSDPQLVADASGGAVVVWGDYRNLSNDLFAQRLDPSGSPLWAADGIPVTTAVSFQGNASISPDGAGGVLCAWEDYRNLNDGDIYVQRVNATGVPLWTLDGVALCSLSTPQERPAVVSDGSGGAVVTWEDSRGINPDDCYAQRVNASGTPQWTVDGVSICTDVGIQGKPQIVSDGSGAVILAWQDERTLWNGIHAQKVTAAGAPQWPLNGVALCPPPGTQRSPRMAPDGSNGAIVAWNDDREGAFDIYVQRVDGAGITRWTTDGTPLCLAPDAQLAPRITAEGTGGAIVTWTDYRSGTADIYARRVDASGSPLWTTDGVAACSAAGAQSSPEICADGSGGAIIAWVDDRNGTPDLYVQRLSGAGVPQWTANGVPLCTAAGSQDALQISSDGSGGALLCWADARTGTTDIYVQKIDGTGAVLWAADGLLLCGASGAQTTPQLIPDASGGAIVTWKDARGPNANIYVQKVNQSGQPQWQPDGIRLVDSIGDQDRPQLVADGAGGAILAWQDSSPGSRIYLQRLDTSGAPLWELSGKGVAVSANQQTEPRLISDGSGGVIVGWLEGPHLHAQRFNGTGIAQWTAGGVAVNPTFSMIQENPCLIPAGAGGVILGWRDRRYWPLEMIYAQFINGTGNQ